MNLHARSSRRDHSISAQHEIENLAKSHNSPLWTDETAKALDNSSK